MSYVLRAYVVSGYEPADEAVLVFARTAREARNIGWGRLEWCDDFMAVRARWVRGHVAEEYRRPENEAAGIPYVVNPPICRDCEFWHAEGLDSDGRCESCADYHRADLDDAAEAVGEAP